MTYFWSLINSLQIILYTNIIPIQFPAVINMSNKFFFPLIRLDYIPEGLYNNIFSFSLDLQKPYNQRVEDMGYDDHNLI